MLEEQTAVELSASTAVVQGQFMPGDIGMPFQTGNLALLHDMSHVIAAHYPENTEVVLEGCRVSLCQEIS